MKPYLLFFFPAILLIALTGYTYEQANTNKIQLVGEWEFKDDSNNAHIVILGHDSSVVYVSHHMKVDHFVKFSVNESKTPVWIDFHYYKFNKELDFTKEGILKVIDDNKIVIKLADKRPEMFGHKGDGQYEYIRLR